MCALVVSTSHRATIVLRARTAQVGAARVDPPDHSGQGEHCRRKADPRPGDVRVSRICCSSVPPGRDKGRGYRTVRPAVRAKRDAKYGTPAQRTGREVSAVYTFKNGRGSVLIFD
eukprot:scaffold34254_cov65-Phaeocystis_antarctica.AAC.4